MTQGAAIRAKCRADPVPISILQVGAFATHPTPARRATCFCISRSPGGLQDPYATVEKGTSDEKDSHTRGHNAGIDYCDGRSRLRRSLRAAPMIHNLQSAKPTDVGGASARAYIIQNANIQNGRMRSLDGWIFRTQNGTYFNPRTGVTCTAAAAACF